MTAIATNDRAVATGRPEAVARRRPRRGTGTAAARLLVVVVLIVYAIGSIIPIVWLAVTPSKTAAQVSSMHPLAFGDWANYATAWSNLLTYQDGVVLQWAVNSVWYTAAIVALSCVTGVCAGYALAVTAMPFRKSLLTLTLVAMVIPPVGFIVPLFIEISRVGLFDTPLAVIITGSFFPFGVFLSYIHFSTAIPAEIYEAARMDGSTEFGIFVRIAVPLSRGLIGMLAFFSFTATWVNYFLPYVLLGSPSKMTLPVGLGVLFSSTPALNPGHGTMSAIGIPEIALAGLLLSLPILVVFVASSRLLVRGMLSGAVKS